MARSEPARLGFWGLKKQPKGRWIGPSVRGGGGGSLERNLPAKTSYQDTRPDGRAGVVYAASPSERSSADLGCAPIAAAAGSPSLKRIIVGIDMTP